MVEAVRSNIDVPSLGAIPRDIDEVWQFEEHGPWTPEQPEKMDDFASQETLFGDPISKVLHRPWFKVRLRHSCQQLGCPGHTQRIVGWKVTALQGPLSPEVGGGTAESRSDGFMDRMFGPTKAPLIFVGSPGNPQRRQSFTVLGAYYPNIQESSPSCSDQR